MQNEIETPCYLIVERLVLLAESTIRIEKN